MIEAEHSLLIDAGIDGVWDYVQDIRKWAVLFPGCRECVVIDANDSRWTIKVGAGGLVKTVNVLVRVDQWDGPERVNFSFRLEGEPVEGSGAYVATRTSGKQTRISLKMCVQGGGPMAPMWEAVSKPLLPQMAKSFAGRLKAEIEATLAGGAITAPRPAFGSASGRWLRAAGDAFHSFLRVLLTGRRSEDMTEKNKQVVTTFIEAMGRSDGAAAIPCLDPEAFTLAKGFGKFAGIRHYDTIVGTIDAFKQLLPTGLRPTIQSVTAEGDRVVVEFEGNAETCDGQPYCNQYCMVFTMRDGRIRQVNEYFCTILADRVLWPLVEKMQNPAAG